MSGYSRYDNDSIAYAGMVDLQGTDILTNYYRDQNAFVPPALSNTGDIEPFAVITANCLILKSAFTAVGGFNEKFVYAGGEDTELGLRLRHVGKLRYNYHSVARHEIIDGLGGFVRHFIRYGHGGRLLSEHYFGNYFAPTKISINNPT